VSQVSLDTLVGLPEGLSTFITRDDGTRLRCMAYGEGPTLILAHGIFGDLRVFNLLRGRLIGRGWRVILFDQRGHGASTIGADGLGARQMAADCKAVLEHFDVQDAVLLGHSMGAFLSICLAEYFPDVVQERLRGMLLIAGHAGNVARGSIQNRLQIPLVKAGLLPVILSSGWLGRAFARSLFGRVAGRELVEATRRILSSQPLEVMTPLVDFQVREDHYPALAGIAVRTVVLCGERDRTCPRWHSERLGAEIPSARNHWLPDIGHMVVYEAPEAIEDALLQLLENRQ